MQQDRIKTVFWLWLFKSLQPCLGGRRSSCETGAPPVYTRFGRLPLSNDSFGGASRTFRAHRHHTRGVFPDNYHGITLPTATATAAGAGGGREEEQQVQARPVNLKGKGKRREAEPSSTVTTARTTTTEASFETDTTVATRKNHAFQLTYPVIEQDAWDATTGTEFQDNSLVEALTQSALDLCTSNGDENSYVEWFSHSNNDKLLQDHGNSAMLAMEEGEVFVYVGKSKQQDNIVGSNLPLIKTKAILPLSAKEMADLLMDSSKVKIYNKMSLGRKDIAKFGKNTKVVRNLTQPPVAKSKMVSVTLMHSRALTDKDRLPSGPKSGYIVVSRAVPGMIEDDLKDVTRNDILLGVNLLQDLGPNECLMTAVTHVYSPALPAMFAQSMGVSSAVNFVKDIRESCEPAGVAK